MSRIERRQFLGTLCGVGLGGTAGLVRVPPRQDRSARGQRDGSLDDSAATWDRTYGSDRWDLVEDVVESPDGGYAFTGTHGYSLGGRTAKAWLVSVRHDGTTQWELTLHNDSEANAIVGTDEGDYVIGGRDGSNGLVARVSADGTTRWTKTYSDSSDARIRSLVDAHDGGYLFAGGTTPADSGENVWVVKTDPDGVPEWEQSPANAGDNWANAVIATTDGDYLVAGRMVDRTHQVPFLLKLSPSGDVRWLRRYTAAHSAGAASVIETSDGGYLFPGKVERDDGGVDAWLVSVDGIGQHQATWRYAGYGATATAESAMELADGGYLFYGATAGDDGTEDFWMGRTATDGTLEWERNWGGPEDDYAFTTIPTSDGGYLVTGNEQSGGDYDARLLKYPSLPGPEPTPSGTSTVTSTSATATETATESNTTEPDPSVTSARRGTASGDSTTTQVPGFGLLGAFAGLAGAGYLHWRRSRSE